tara:strand:+ start:69 stop:449 length:381 start_codon:yes stop_codon:yes gene_type:complete
MLVAAFEPGQEMAIANFFLAIFCLFTITLPLLLITRGEKTEANRNFVSATINPWSKIDQEIELTPVVISGITPPTQAQSKLEVISENHDESASEPEVILSIEKKGSEELEALSTQELATIDEVLAA